MTTLEHMCSDRYLLDGYLETVTPELFIDHVAELKRTYCDKEPIKSAIAMLSVLVKETDYGCNQMGNGVSCETAMER